METKHTKGKWSVSDEQDNGIFIPVENTGGSVAKMYTKNLAVSSHEEALANAKLIASAPTMLEYILIRESYLKNCANNGVLSKVEKSEYDTIRELIKQATG